MDYKNSEIRFKKRILLMIHERLNDIARQELDEPLEDESTEQYAPSPYDGPAPKLDYDDEREIGYNGAFNQQMSDGASQQFSDGEKVMWSEKDKYDSLSGKYGEETVVKQTAQYALIYHGTVVGQMGSIVKVLADTVEKRLINDRKIQGKLTRLRTPEVKFVQARKLKIEQSYYFDRTE